MLCFMEHNLLVVLCYSLFLLRTVYIIYNKSERESGDPARRFE